MIGWIIAGGVLFLILLVLFSSVKAEIRSDGALTLSAGIGFLKFRIIPKKKKKPPRVSSFSQKKYLSKLRREEEKAKKREAKKAKAEKPAKEKEEEKKPKSFSEKFDEIKDLLSVIVETAGKYSKKLRITIRRLYISVGASEASDVALRYGAVSQGAAYLLEFLDVNTTLSVKDGAVDVRADFVSGSFDFFADVTVSIRVISALRIAFSVLIKKIKHG